MRRPVGFGSWTVVAMFACVACGGSTSSGGAADAGAGDASDSGAGDGSDAGLADGGASDGGGRTPLHHRPDDSQCSQPAPAGNCPAMMGLGACSKDTDCTMGTNGRCVENMGGALTCNCSYDTCVHDADCGAGKLCVCHGSAFNGGTGNACVAGNCRIDADCGQGKYCSPSHGTSGCGGVTGYYCHVAADTCTDDGDCSGGGAQVCAWSAMNNRWECQGQLLCP